MKQRFDEFIPIGTSCTVSWHLRDTGFQNRSLPFDWLLISCQVVCEMLENDFSGFLVLDKLKPDPEFDPRSGCRRFMMPNGIRFWHDFVFPDPAREFASVWQRYRRRISRLKKMIKKAKRVLFVLGEKENYFTNEELENLRKRLAALYPGKVVKILYLRFNRNRRGYEFVLRSPGVDVVDLEYGTHPNPDMHWIADVKAFRSMMTTYDYTRRHRLKEWWDNNMHPKIAAFGKRLKRTCGKSA